MCTEINLSEQMVCKKIEKFNVSGTFSLIPSFDTQTTIDEFRHRYILR